MSRERVAHQLPGPATRPAGSRGFTLVETVVVMFILALALAVTLPNLQRARVMAGTNRGLNAVMNVIYLARSEAVKGHRPVGFFYTSGNPGTFTVFVDWTEGATDPSNGQYEASEVVLESRLYEGSLVLVDKPATSTIAKIATMVYKYDGSPLAGAGAYYLQDTPGNLFRIRINTLTGAAIVEMWTTIETDPLQMGWSPGKESWVWKY